MNLGRKFYLRRRRRRGHTKSGFHRQTTAYFFRRRMSLFRLRTTNGAGGDACTASPESKPSALDQKTVCGYI